MRRTFRPNLGARLDCRALVASCLIAAAAMAYPCSRNVWGAEPLELTFKGTVEPLQRVQVANQIDGVVSKVLVSAGQHVDLGQLLFEMDAEPFKIDVVTARAKLDEAHARLRLAGDVAGRQSRLLERGVGAQARAEQTGIEVDVARAAVASQEGNLARAELALARTRVVASISGIVGRPRVAPGTFVEAKAGTTLTEIVQLDPVLVAYQVPYADRQQALEKAGLTTPREIFERIVLNLELPSGRAYPHSGEPKFESAEIDRTSGMLTTWAEFPNPDGILVPGLEVRILAHIHAKPIARE